MRWNHGLLSATLPLMDAGGSQTADPAMHALSKRLAHALREAYSYALEGSTPKVDSTRTFVCDLAGEALAEFDAQVSVPHPSRTADGQTVDRLLGLADQFMADWREDVDDCASAHDADLVEREAEWVQWRPRIIACVNAVAGIGTDLLVNGTPEEIARALLGQGLESSA